MYRRDAAREIRVLDRFESNSSHHLHEPFLIWKLRHRIGKILVCPSRTADDSTDARQDLCEIEIEESSKAGDDRTRKLKHDKASTRTQDSMQLAQPVAKIR